MATAAQRASKVTTLKVGQVEVSVGLFSVEAKPGQLQKFDTAGPNGGVLKARQVARPTPETSVMEATFTEPVQGDPLGDEVVDVREQDGAVFVPAEPEHKFVVDGEDFTLSQSGDSVTIYPEGAADAIGTLDIGRGGGFSGKGIVTEGGARMLGALAAGESVPVGEVVAMGEPQDELARALNLAQPGDTVTVTETISYGGAVDGEYGRELVEEGSGAVVKPEDVRRGVRLEDGSFVDCTEQLEQIDEDTQLEGMEVVSFVDVTRISRARVKGAQYIGVGDENAAHPLRLFFEAMKATRRAAVVKVTKRSRQSLGVIVATGKVLMLIDLMFAADFRPAPTKALAIQKVAVSSEAVAVATELVRAMAGTVDTLDELADDAIVRRAELRAQALAGEVQPVQAPEPVTEREALLAQLEASLAAV